MKKYVAAFSFCLIGWASMAQARLTDEQYNCVAIEMAKLNPAYSGIRDIDIQTMLEIVEMAGHLDALNAAKICKAR